MLELIAARVLLAVLLAGCSSLEIEGTKIDYRSAAKAPTLEIPPDLSQISRDTRYATPGVAVTASSQQGAKPVSTVTAPSSMGDVRIERADPALDAIVPANPKIFQLAESLSHLVRAEQRRPEIRVRTRIVRRDAHRDAILRDGFFHAAAHLIPLAFHLEVGDELGGNALAFLERN